MKTYDLNTKKMLRDELLLAVESSGLSNNRFASERLGFSSASKLSHILNGWDKENLVGDDTWTTIENFLMRTRGYKGVVTENLRRVFEVCDRAYSLRSVEVLTGDGGYGKSFALGKYKEKIEANSNGRIKVYYFDASEVKTRKQAIVGIMQAVDCYKEGTIASQLTRLREHVAKQKCLIVIDEVSSFEGKTVTVLKDIINAVKDNSGLVLAGTPYFLHNVNRGAAKERHLYSELKDRFFMLPTSLQAPTDDEAEAIFKANGLHGEALEIALGKRKELIRFSWKNKPTFRGIADCITMIKAMNTSTTQVKQFELI